MRDLVAFSEDATDYDNLGIGCFENASNIEIYHAINGDYYLKFTLPDNDEKWELAQLENKVGWGDEIFVIKAIDNKNVLAYSLLDDAMLKHCPIIEDMINMPVNEIVDKIFERVDKKLVKVLNEDEASALGLKLVKEDFDFFAMGRTTPVDAITVLMEQLSSYRIHSELYIHGNNIAIVESLGTNREIIIDKQHNAKDIKPSHNSADLCTRLYPYGKDGMTIDGDVPYIDSPLIDNYSKVHENFVNFDKITEKADLLEAGKRLFKEGNPDRIDVPKYSLEIDYLDVNTEVNIGDTVVVKDRDFNITTRQNVVSTTKYPLEPHKNKFTVGKVPITIETRFRQQVEARDYLKKARNECNAIKTPNIEFMKSNEEVKLTDGTGKMQKIAKYDTGALFVSPDGEYAVAIMDGKVQIGKKDERKDDGWNWTGIFDNNQVKVGKVFTGELYTNLCAVMSQNGKLEIRDSLITMCDNSNQLRFEAGYKGTQYIFALYDANGKKNMYIDDNGNLTMTGIFKTGEKGEDRIVIDGNGIQSYDKNGNKAGLWSNYNAAKLCDLALYYNDKEMFKIYNAGDGVSLMRYGSPFLIAGMNGRITCKGNWKFDNGASGSFVSADGKTITVNKGLITNIG